MKSYSEKIIIADNLKQRFMGLAFIGPHSYDKTYDLEIKNGKIIEYKDTSGTYKGL